ncbi:ubiquinol-cytochrome C chaperone family protein [Terrarubrum flagellatum]|uniref:ubiquinol-cytochrome C chaperone family protein n=1 Tax=Terrirubrum flagellatum TaxID=2895980 RepID=UPI0031453C23
MVAGARRPDLYLRLGAPDNPFGRIESVMLHALLVVRRLRALPPPAGELAQDLIDRMFTDFDRAFRQIGISDIAVPKKMRSLGGDWLGRVEAYSGPLDRRDERELAAALARNVMSRDGEAEAALPLALQVFACEDALAKTDWRALQTGRIEWPAVVEAA